MKKGFDFSLKKLFFFLNFGINVKCIPLIVFLVFFSILSNAQLAEIEHEVGIGAGVANYFGDLNDHFGTKGIDMSAGVFYRANIGKRFAVRTGINYSKIGYKDSYSTREYNRQRNLSFRSNVFDLNTQFEINFLEFVRSVYYNKEGFPFTPYLAVGVGVFFFNPQAELNGKYFNLQPLGTEGQTDPSYSGISKYNLYNFAIIYGGGIKYHVNKNISVAAEFSVRKTFTDYLDDVSGYYSPVMSLPDADQGIAAKLANRSPEVGYNKDKTGKMRGTLDGSDDFATFQISFSWTFINSVCRYNYQ